MLTLPLKGMSLGANLLIVPLALKLLGTEAYGIWIVISGIISWANLLDFGLVHGLRNLLSVKIAERDFLSSKKILSSAYLYLVVMGGIFWACSYLLLKLYMYEITEYFKYGHGVIKVISILLISFTCSFILKPIHSVSQAYQKPYINQIVGTTSNILILTVLYLLFNYSKSITLYLFAMCYAFIPVVVTFLASLHLFSTKFLIIKPSVSLINMASAKETITLGTKFLLIQLMVLVLYSTDNFVIMTLFSANEVVPINASHKLFSVFLIAGNTLLVPYWSAFTNAYVLKDIVWIRRAIIRISIYICLSVFLIGLFVLFSKNIYQLWLGDSVSISSKVTYVQALFVVNSIFIAGLSAFLNGLSLLKIQTYTYVIAAILNIPFSLLFALKLGWGPVGVITGTVIVQFLVILGLFYAVIKGLNGLNQVAHV